MHVANATVNKGGTFDWVEKCRSRARPLQKVYLVPRKQNLREDGQLQEVQSEIEIKRETVDPSLQPLSPTKELQQASNSWTEAERKPPAPQISGSELRKHLSTFKSLEAVLTQIHQLWPHLRSGSDTEADVTSVKIIPADAAVALHVLSKAVLKLPLGRRILLGRDATVGMLVHSMLSTVFQSSEATLCDDASSGVSHMQGLSAPAEVYQNLGCNGVSSGIWSLGVLGGAHTYRKELSVLCKVVPLCRVDLSKRQIADICWGFATAQYIPQYLAQLDAAAAQRASQFTPSEASCICWSFATLGTIPVLTLLELNKEAEGYVSLMSAQQLAMCVWSLAVMQKVNDAMFKAAWQAILQKGLEGMGDNKTMKMQIYQAALSIHLEGEYTIESLGPMDQGARALLSAAKEQWCKEADNKKSKMVSRYQREIASCLQHLGVVFVEEGTAGAYSVDMVLPHLRIAIEAEGPSHMALNKTSKRLGHTLLKHRHLRKAGWKVLAISYLVWDGLANRNEQITYLERELNSLSSDIVVK